MASGIFYACKQFRNSILTYILRPHIIIHIVTNDKKMTYADFIITRVDSCLDNEEQIGI